MNVRRILLLTLLLLGLATRVIWMTRAPFPQHFWMDERFSAAIITQPVDKLLLFCRKDVHPPLYYLLLKGWNRVGLIGHDETSATQQRILDYRLPGIGREGYFLIEDARGERREVPGLYPADWSDWPLAPLNFLRLPSIAFALIAAAFLYQLARRLYPDEALVSYLALAMALFSPFMLTWDTTMRSYAMMGACAMLMAWWVVADRRGWAWLVALAALVAVALLTGYVLVLLLPCLPLCAMLLARKDPNKKLARTKRGFAIAASVIAGMLLFALVWGRAFLAQGRLRVPPQESLPLAGRIASQAGEMIGLHWQMLFSYGVVANLNPFTSALGYIIAFSIYGAALVAFAVRVVKRSESADIAVAVLALGPSAMAVVLNAMRPETLPIQVRYFYPFAPFYFLLLSRGLGILLNPVLGRLRR